MEPIYFASPDELRRWLHDNADAGREAWIGLHKKASGRASITWPELVDQLLCFGWIDGVRRSIDENSYAIRITPRKPKSNWSAVNLRRMPELIEAGLVQPAGLAAWEARDEARATRYSYERETATLDAAMEAEFRAHEEAWAYFQAQPPGYRKTATIWVVTARREDTRRRRLATLIDDSAHGRRIAPLRRE
jgi:uncharacterized protein YdeI (YjbR/CyaY-like superfamily)